MSIGPGGFDALRIPLLRGRTFDRDDGPGTERVTIVSERLARNVWPDGDAIGRRLRLHSEAPPGDLQPGEWHTVIGVVGDVRRAITDDATPEIYFAIAQSGLTALTVVIRPRDGSRSPLPGLRSGYSGWTRRSRQTLIEECTLGTQLDHVASLGIERAAVRSGCC